MKQVELYTDGACSGNPGPGGWGALLRYNGHEKELSGGARNTTNNRMELLAVIEGLAALKDPCHVTIYTDSKYVMDSAMQFLDGWLKRDWRTADRQKVKNIDLWERYIHLRKTHDIHWQWVKGHNGHVENERVDALARAAIPFES